MAPVMCDVGEGGWVVPVWKLRMSAQVSRGRAVDVIRSDRELGVRYVLEGSVRKAGGRVRITGQLIGALTGIHLWGGPVDCV